MKPSPSTPREAGSSWTRRLVAAAVTALVLGVGLLVLQRWVAETFQVAVALVVVWFVVIATCAFVYGRRHPDLRLPMLATIGVIAVASGAIGYWTGFRKDEVDEDVVAATVRADDGQRTTALAGGEEPMPREDVQREPSGPVELAMGEVDGADGHAGEGKATVVETEDGDRVLTLTEFDVDAGPDVNVYLSETSAGIEGAVELGDLKGEIGDQQYEIPGDVDLTKFDDLVLYCIPFTTRIATAELR